MTADAIRPVAIKTKIIADMIFPSRRIFCIPATAEAMEKKTSGTIAVKINSGRYRQGFEAYGIGLKNKAQNGADDNRSN